MKLTREEKRIEEASLRGEYVSVSKKEFNRIKRMLDERKKSTVIKIRINNGDLQSLKKKAAKMGVKYQTFIAEVLHRIAAS
jgi:predicted DNA binding CopG/RHH family protein